MIAEANNNWMSGGLPHSEIQGSKPITGSPWLIAGYHVLHRLLLPRHPPNALLALDLIQEKTGSSRSKVVLSSRHQRWFVVDVIWLVYLTWIVTCFAGRAGDTPTLGGISTKLMCISLYDVNSSDWTAKRNALRFAIQSISWWSVAGSNR